MSFDAWMIIGVGFAGVLGMLVANMPRPPRR